MPSVIEAKLSELWLDPVFRAVIIVIGAIVVALLLRVIMERLLPVLTRKTETEFDDQVIATLKRPVSASVVLAGFAWAIEGFGFGAEVEYVAYGALKTVAVLVWASAAIRLGSHVLGVLSRAADRTKVVQPHTLPLFDILVKIIVVGSAAYFAFLSWEINVTGWLASAGILGIAVGFAAKDTLANLFAGIFILADAPYKLGDFIIFESGERGRVTDIGIRSTRILTRDDIEITVPNAAIANSRIVNESGGPHEMERVRVTVEAAYGSDIDQVREVLLGCAQDMTHVAKKPEPRVRFREFGASGLRFQLMAWIDEPVLRGRVLDKLNGRVYEAFNQAGIEIPYAKQDVYVKELPRAERLAS